MSNTRKITERESAPQEMPTQSKLRGAASFTTAMLKNVGYLRKFMTIGPDEERYVRPPRRYEIPLFHEGMKYCTSNEKYLRPTRWCNPCEPEVIAMANELGAYEKTDYDFAEAVFWFIRTKMVAEMLPLDSAGATLRRGTGSCYHLTNVFVALCRAAGIKARYKTYVCKQPQELRDAVVREEGGADVFEVLDVATPEAEGEVCIDGKWVIAHVIMPPEVCAVTGLPITHLGEDSMNVVLHAVPGSIKRFESIPLRLTLSMKFGLRLVPGLMERFNVIAQKKVLEGEKILKEAGGVEAYDQNARMKYGLSTSMTGLKDDDALVFEE